MHPIYCIMFTFSLNDDMRDLLLQIAYLMLKSDAQKKKVRSAFCEGIVTRLGYVCAHGTGGIEFEARLETEQGDQTVRYMVRPQDLRRLEEMEHCAWLSDEDLEDLSEDELNERIRPNPIRKVARNHLSN